MKISDLRQAHAKAAGELQRLTVVGGPAYDAKKAEVVELIEQISRAETAQRLSAASAVPVAGQDNVHQVRAATHGQGAVFKNAQTGEVIKTYRHDEPLARAAARPDYGIGDIVKAVVSGNWKHLPSSVQRAGSSGIGPAGGFLVPSELAGWVIDLARAKARVLQAGALTLPMEAGTLSIATVTGDPQPTWKSENAWYSATQGTYGRVNLEAHTLGVLVPLSIELVTSAANIDRIVTDQITKSMALTLDAAAIFGDGTKNAPRGITSHGTIGQVAFPTPAQAGTTPLGYGAFNSAIGLCLAANAELENLSVLMNSDVSTLLSGAIDTLGQPRRPPATYQAIRDRKAEYIANSIASSGSPKSSYAVVGDFSNVIIGMQQDLMVEISREGTYQNADSSMGSAFGQGQVVLRAYMLCDVAIQRPNFFAQVTGIQISGWPS